MMRHPSIATRALAAPLLLAALLLAAPGLPGCGAKRTTETTTETVEYPAGSTLPDGQVAERDTQVKVTRETTTVTEKDSGCHGVVGCTGKVVWEVIKLPFRILGFVIDVII
ncbi:MAG TPA: hypothetical protein VKB65_11130 [Myxococcota bacterium]|nr:hypothetical protein [Myxococcota bacterium]